MLKLYLFFKINMIIFQPKYYSDFHDDGLPLPQNFPLLNLELFMKPVYP